MENINFPALLGILSGIVLVGANVPYLLSIIRGKTRPSIVSWLGWTFILSIALAGQIAEGASWSVIVAGATVLGDASILTLALIYGYTRLTLIDKLAFILGGTAIAAWVATDDPVAGIILAIVADFIVAIPTLAKTFRDPSSEPTLLWFIFAFGSGLGIFATTTFDIANLALPIYLLFINGLIGVLALRNKSAGQNKIA